MNEWSCHFNMDCKKHKIVHKISQLASVLVDWEWKFSVVIPWRPFSLTLCVHNSLLNKGWRVDENPVYTSHVIVHISVKDRNDI